MSRTGLQRVIVIACIPSSVAVAGAQRLPDTLWIPMIFYDFHPDGSNPNFQIYAGGHVMPGMVQDTLDSYRKPVLRESLFWNDRIPEWYRPSAAGGSDPDAEFVVDPEDSTWKWTNLVPREGGTAGEFVSPSFDPAYEMANVVIYDSLPFLRRDDLGSGTC